MGRGYLLVWIPLALGIVGVVARLLWRWQLAAAVIPAKYQTAMQASFDPARWPVQEEVDLGPSTTLILREGMQIPSGGTAIGYVPGEHISWKREDC
jgi:hypothetical protein